MQCLEVLTTNEEIEKHYVNVANITNLICTEGKIIVYTGDGFKGKIIKRYSSVQEMNDALDKLNVMMGFFAL